jgi:hypothetical protein
VAELEDVSPDSRFPIIDSRLSIPASRFPIIDSRLSIPASRLSIPDYRFPIPDYRFPIPDYRFPIIDSLRLRRTDSRIKNHTGDDAAETLGWDVQDHAKIFAQRLC